jgi:hypothetical protein
MCGVADEGEDGISMRPFIAPIEVSTQEQRRRDVGTAPFHNFHNNIQYYVRFEVFTAVTMKKVVF